MDKSLSGDKSPQSLNVAGGMIFRRVGWRQLRDGEVSKALRLDRGSRFTADRRRLGRLRWDRWMQRGVGAKKWGEVPQSP